MFDLSNLRVAYKPCTRAITSCSSNNLPGDRPSIVPLALWTPFEIDYGIISTRPVFFFASCGNNCNTSRLCSGWPARKPCVMTITAVADVIQDRLLIINGPITWVLFRNVFNSRFLLGFGVIHINAILSLHTQTHCGQIWQWISSCRCWNLMLLHS